MNNKRSSYADSPEAQYLAYRLASRVGPLLSGPHNEGRRSSREVVALMNDNDTVTAFEVALTAIERTDANQQTRKARSPEIFVLAGVVSLLSAK